MRTLSTNVGTELPATASRTTLEGAGKVGGNPASIEITFLGLNLFPGDVTAIDALGIEGEMIAQDCISLAG
jgi:hypothetical protein